MGVRPCEMGDNAVTSNSLLLTESMSDAAGGVNGRVETVLREICRIPTGGGGGGFHVYHRENQYTA